MTSSLLLSLLLLALACTNTNARTTAVVCSEVGSAIWSKTNDLFSLLPVVGPVLGEVSSVMKDLATLNAGCETTAEVTVAVVKDIVKEAVDAQAMKDLKIDMDVLMYSMNPEIYDDFDADDYQEFQEYATKAEGRAANIGYPAVQMLLQAAAIKIAAAVAVHELDKANQVVGMTPGGAEKNVKNKVDEGNPFNCCPRSKKDCTKN